MLGLKRSHATSFALVAAASALFAMAAPSGCFYPDYTFDENATGAGGPGPTTTSTHSGNPMSSSTTSTASHTTSSTTNPVGTGGDSTTGTGGASTTGMGGATGVGGTISFGGGGSTADGMGGGPCSDNYKCVAAVPTGFSGYFSLYDGDPATDPGCGGNFPDDGYFGNAGIQAPDADCECSCGNPKNEKCVPPTEFDIFDATCEMSQNSICYYPFNTPANWTGSCYIDATMCYAAGGKVNCGNQPIPANDCMQGAPDTGVACIQSMFSNPPTVTGGSCTATLTPTVPPVSWSRLGHACQATLGDATCSGTSVCAPRPTGGGFATGVCVMQTGDVMCPAPFLNKHLFYGGDDDTRMCSGACACDAPQGGSCTVHIKVFSDTSGTCTANCAAGNEVAEFDAGDCVDVAGNPSAGSRSATISAVTGSSCTVDASAVSSTGQATPNAPTTFCCTQ
jgi:hypothetical protein